MQQDPAEEWAERVPRILERSAEAGGFEFKEITGGNFPISRSI